jgi:ubiquinone/menaquinone biosynthesis C-methylase UbiE
MGVFYSGILERVYSIVHRLIEIPYNEREDLRKVIEVGAGNGQHFPFVRHKFENYLMTDLDKDILPENSSLPQRISAMALNADNLVCIEDSSFDRLIATCLVAHLEQPSEALHEWRRVVRHGGKISIYVAPEPGMLVRLVRLIFIFPKMRMRGVINPSLLYYTQHRNHYMTISTLIDSVFEYDEVKKRRFPLHLPWNFILFEIVDITLNKSLD